MELIIKKWNKERPGNDCWINLRLVLGIDWDDDLVLRLDEKWSGWQEGKNSKQLLITKTTTGIQIVDYVNEFCDYNEEDKKPILQEILDVLTEYKINLKL